MGLFRPRRVARLSNGTYRFSVPVEERALLKHVIPQLREMLTGAAPGDERLRRLYPNAYVANAEAEAEYQKYMHEELLASRLAALDEVEKTFDATVLTESEIHAWMQSVNSVRLVLGTVLDVSEGLDLSAMAADDPAIEGYVLYDFLSYILQEVVEALAG